jgi:guanidinoacetate N-methyltransferase
MKRRTFTETIVKSAHRLATTPPNTWYRQWKEAFISLPGADVPDTRTGYLDMKASYSDGQLLVGNIEVMQDWERPLMRALAEEAARNAGHVLEVGFGMGISADYLIQAGCTEYTAIEPHQGVLEFFNVWAKKQPVPVHVVKGFWEDVIDGLPRFDGILFDTYPVSKSEMHDKVYLPFIEKASEHLHPGGVFAFYSGYPDALPNEHTSLLKKHFSRVEFTHVGGLRPPKDCQYYRHSRMVVPICVK